MINVDVGNNILISGLPDFASKALKKALTIPNKEFFKMQRMGFWAPRDFKYFKEVEGASGSSLLIPRGCRTRLMDYLAKCGVVWDVVDNSVEKEAKLGISKLILREYQSVIVDKIVAERPTEGIIVSSTGSGKTLMSLEIAHRLGLSATILTHNTVLADQFVSEAQKYYGIKAARIDATHKEIGDLTVSTFQSLFGAPKLLKELAANTSVLIVDEAQGIVSKERKKVLDAFSPKHLFGLSATPERTDSLTPAIFFLLGHPIANHEMAQAQPSVEIIRTGIDIKMADSYHRIIDAMVESQSRNTLIAGLATGEALQGRKVLVLTKRIQHYEKLKSHLPDFTGVYFIDSDDPDRNNLLARFKRGEEPFSIIFGTTSLLAVGTDIPALDTLILACDMKSSVLTTQSVGRILRLFEGKPTPKVIDLYDNKNPILARQFFERKRLYQKKNWKIIE